MRFGIFLVITPLLHFCEGPHGPASEPWYCLNRTPQINGLMMEKDREGQPRNPLKAWQPTLHFSELGCSTLESDT